LAGETKAVLFCSGALCAAGAEQLASLGLKQSAAPCLLEPLMLLLWLTVDTSAACVSALACVGCELQIAPACSHQPHCNLVVANMSYRTVSSPMFCSISSTARVCCHAAAPCLLIRETTLAALEYHSIAMKAHQHAATMCVRTHVLPL
jgi:hypothetical protein